MAFWKRRAARIGGAAAAVALAGRAFFGCGASGAQVPTAVVERGDLRISHFESGEIRAVHDEKIVSPRVDGELKIVRLWPEGEKVDVGDLLLQFDLTEFAKEVKDEAGELEKAKADLDKAQAEQQQRLTELEIQVEQKQAALELARINLTKAQYASPVEKEQRQIALGQAERAVTQARTNLEAQQIIDRVERANLDLRIAQCQQRYDKATKDYDRLTVYAEKAGIVVYETIRKRGGDRQGKVTEGDVVWGGTSLLSLPDLSTMEVYSQVGEMDVQHVEVGQPAFIRLEAFPGPVFHGTVAAIAPIASELEDVPNVQIFEMTVAIDEQDERLYPGMSASVEVVVGAVPGALMVPLSAVFERDGKPVVYRADGRRFDPIGVELGRDNGVAAVVEAGLAEGDVIALVDLAAL